MKFSLVLLGLFLLGVVAGATGLAPQILLLDTVSLQLVRLLLLLVGLGMGLDPQFFDYLRQINPRMLFVPAGIAIGSLLGAGLVSLLLPGISIRDGAAVGAGLGYYSLSSILIGQARGPQLGVVALISNILREMSTLLLAPFLVRAFGKLAPVASAGATSSDTSLPVIQRYTDSETTLIAVVNGLVLTLLVPFLVSFLV
ncbi:MAG: lysine exporter LysO family protein [Anaerolineaceae bacterium]|nr:lysine exporter LysO family protein [Anaerolineaceae bacterium]